MATKRQRNPRSYPAANVYDMATYDFTKEFDDVLNDGFLDECAMAEIDDED